MGEQLTTAALAQKIDHTLLRADAGLRDIIAHCDEALECGFYSVCINPVWILTCRQHLQKSPVKICTVVGFPLGANTSFTKAAMTSEAVEIGADEIDMVIHLGAVKSKDWGWAEKDIQAVVKAAQGKTIKVILETALLTKEEKQQACRVSQSAGANFVKTSTGFGPGGATVEDVQLLRATVSKSMQVKASGGIRDLTTLKAMLAAGADRIGASAGKKLFGHSASAGAY